MADIKEVGGAVGGTSVIDDNTEDSLVLQSSDGNDVLTVDTRDGAEVTQLSAAGAAGLEVHVASGNAEVRLADEVGFISDPDLMMRRYGTNTIEFRAAGTDVFRISNSGCLVENGTLTLGSGAILYHQGTGSDTATTQAVYLADTNATLIIDFANGNIGDVTLAAGVTAVKFWNVPADGTSATVTARITQDSSNRTIDYSDSAVTCYSDGGSSAVTGEIKFSGGVHHTQSTGSGDVDVISFTSIPTGSTFNIYAAVIGQDFS